MMQTYMLEKFHLTGTNPADHAEERKHRKNDPYPCIVPDFSEPRALCSKHAIDKDQSPHDISACTMIFINSFATLNWSKYFCGEVKHGNPDRGLSKQYAETELYLEDH